MTAAPPRRSRGCARNNGAHSVDKPGIWRTRGRDEGTVLLLVIAFAAIAAALITVVVDASKYYLAQRALAADADAMATAAAQAIDEPAAYEGSTDALPLSDTTVAESATAYARDSNV